MSACTAAFPVPATVTLRMDDVQPHLDKLLRYLRAVSDHMHLPPSVFDQLDPSDEQGRIDLVTYAIRYAADRAQEATDDLPLGPGRRGPG